MRQSLSGPRPSEFSPGLSERAQVVDPAIATRRNMVRGLCNCASTERPNACRSKNSLELLLTRRYGAGTSADVQSRTSARHFFAQKTRARGRRLSRRWKFHPGRSSWACRPKSCAPSRRKNAPGSNQWRKSTLGSPLSTDATACRSRREAQISKLFSSDQSLLTSAPTMQGIHV